MIQLNINHALKKHEEGLYFSELMNQPTTTLQGIGPKHEDELQRLGLKTIAQLANYKFYHLAKSMVVLSHVEEADGRSNDTNTTAPADADADAGAGAGAGADETSSSSSGAKMNLNRGLDKDCEHLPLTQLLEQPVQALQGISDTKSELWNALGVKTIADLADFKYCQWAEAIQTAAKFEEVKQEPEQGV